MSRAQIRSKSFVARLNKKQNVEIDSAASSGVEGKQIIAFLWPPLEAALPIFNIKVFDNFFFLEKELIKAKEISINAAPLLTYSMVQSPS